MEHGAELVAYNGAEWIERRGNVSSSNITSISLSADTEVAAIIFKSGAFTILASPATQLIVDGVGISNNSGSTQDFDAGVDLNNNVGLISFTNNATVGNSTLFRVAGGARHGLYCHQQHLS